MVGWITKLGMQVTSPPPIRGHSPQFSAHVYCGQTVAHLSYCLAVVNLGDHVVCTFGISKAMHFKFGMQIDNGEF